MKGLLLKVIRGDVSIALELHKLLGFIRAHAVGLILAQVIAGLVVTAVIAFEAPRRHVALDEPAGSAIFRDG